jgi:hypothetical protein
MKRFLASAGNRLAHTVRQTTVSDTPSTIQCEPRKFSPFIDKSTKKMVVPLDTKCQGKPNVYLIGERSDGSPEYALLDNVGDGKIDAKIIFSFQPNVDLWIVYGQRDGVPTAFGYDYGGKGKPDRIVAVNAAHH